MDLKTGVATALEQHRAIMIRGALPAAQFPAIRNWANATLRSLTSEHKDETAKGRGTYQYKIADGGPIFYFNPTLIQARLVRTPATWPSVAQLALIHSLGETIRGQLESSYDPKVELAGLDGVGVRLDFATEMDVIGRSSRHFDNLDPRSVMPEPQIAMIVYLDPIGPDVDV
jgi:hypothetical protein